MSDRIVPVEFVKWTAKPLIPNSRRRPCWTRSRRPGIAATAGSWRSTATKTGSIRSASRTASRWSPNSIGRPAGAMRPSARSTPLRPSSRPWKFRWSRRGGRWPELGRSDEREWVGRFLGRIHAVGRAARFHERARLSMDDLGRNARDYVLEGDFMPDYLADKYAEVTDELLEEIEARAAGWGG